MLVERGRGEDQTRGRSKLKSGPVFSNSQGKKEDGQNKIGRLRDYKKKLKI